MGQNFLTLKDPIVTPWLQFYLFIFTSTSVSYHRVGLSPAKAFYPSFPFFFPLPLTSLVAYLSSCRPLRSINNITWPC